MLFLVFHKIHWSIKPWSKNKTMSPLFKHRLNRNKPYVNWSVLMAMQHRHICVAYLSNQTQKNFFLKIELNKFSNRGHIYGHFEKEIIQISRKLTKW